MGRDRIKRLIRQFHKKHRRWPKEQDFDAETVAEFVRAYGSFQVALEAGRQSARARQQVVPWTDAMWRRLPGSFESGKRR